jgi:hypothetical protein
MSPDSPDKTDPSTAQSIYRQEKERALAERRISHSQLMAEAKEAFAKMLADAQLARKGGRPRTNPVPPNAAKPAPPAAVVAKKPGVEKSEKPEKPEKPVKAKAVKAPVAKKSPARRAASPKAAKAKPKSKGAKAAARTTKRAVRGKASKKR